MSVLGTIAFWLWMIGFFFSWSFSMGRCQERGEILKSVDRHNYDSNEIARILARGLIVFFLAWPYLFWRDIGKDIESLTKKEEDVKVVDEEDDGEEHA